MDVQQARALVTPYAESDAWESPAVLSKFAQGHRVDFGEFLETLLTLAHRFGVESQTDVEELVEWAPDAPPGTWLPDASDALAAVLTLNLRLGERSQGSRRVPSRGRRRVRRSPVLSGGGQR